jgi:hypothetical protein
LGEGGLRKRKLCGQSGVLLWRRRRNNGELLVFCCWKLNGFNIWLIVLYSFTI